MQLSRCAQRAARALWAKEKRRNSESGIEAHEESGGQTSCGDFQMHLNSWLAFYVMR